MLTCLLALADKIKDVTQKSSQESCLIVSELALMLIIHNINMSEYDFIQIKWVYVRYLVLAVRIMNIYEYYLSG